MPRETRDQGEIEDTREMLAKLDHLVIMVLLEEMVRMVLREKRVCRDQLELLEHLVCKKPRCLISMVDF